MHGTQHKIKTASKNDEAVSYTNPKIFEFPLTY